MEIKVKRTNAQNPASDELYHWRYIKKIRVNGKWRYFYDQASLDAFNKSRVVTTENVTDTYRNSNKLFSDKKTIKVGDKVKTTYNRGKIDRFIDKGRDWLVKKLGGKESYDKYDNNYSESYKKTTVRKNSKNIAGKTTTSKSLADSSVTVIKEDGNFRNAMAKAEKWIYNTFYKDN